MARIDNLDEGELASILRRLKALEVAAPLGSSAISRGALRILSSEGLIVEGSARISGVLDGDGNLSWTGPITFMGPFTVDGVTIQNGDYTVNGPWHLIGDGEITGEVTLSGPFHVSGNTDISGAVEITGPSTSINGSWHLNGDGDIAGDVAVTGDVTVNTPGKILVGGAIPMTIGDAKVAFNSGGSVVGYAYGVRIDSGGAPDIVTSTGGVSIRGVSGAALTVALGVRTVGGINMGSLPTISASGRTPNVWLNPDTNDLYRLT